LAANALYDAAAEARASSSTFGQPGPVTVCDPNGLTSATDKLAVKVMLMSDLTGPHGLFAP